MKRLLRGVIDFGSISHESLAHNYQRLQSSKIQWIQPADEKIFKFVQGFFEAELDLPSAAVLADYFQRAEDHECLERLKDIKSAPSYEGANYSFVLKGLVEDQNRIKFMTLLKESQEVAQKGLVVEEGRQKKRIEGVADAVSYFQQHATDLLQQDANARTRGELREAAMDAKQDYQVAKANPSSAWGALTGIEAIDAACRGLKKGEMHVHAAFAGELKTTLALTWCYNLVTRYRRNVFYASLEMPFRQIRNLICCLHTAHPKWALMGRKPLDYRKIRDGELTEEEEAFYFEALDDFYTNDTYARFELWCPDHDVSVPEIKLEAELLHKQMEVGFIVVDHGGLVKDPNKANKGTTEELNAVMRGSKKLALHFNQGEGVPVLLLFQTNRQGKDEASKSNGRYKMSALSYANECLARGTLVRTDQGLVPIEDVAPGMKAWSSTGWKPVLRRMANGVRPVVRVSTRHGFEETCTGDHLFRVLGEEGLEWAQASDLKGRFVLADLGCPSEGLSLPLPELEVGLYEKANGHQGRPLKTPSRLTEDLAYLIGAHDGDGVEGNPYRVGWTGNRCENEVLLALQRKFRSCFDHDLTVALSKSRPGSFDCYKWSKPLSRWFHQVGMDRQSSISPYILRASPEIQGQYLKGLWDADGSINVQGHLYLGAGQEKKELLRQTQLLMWGLGIPCVLTEGVSYLKGKSYPSFHLVVSSLKGKIRFLAVTGGFSEGHKLARLKKACSARPKERTVWPLGKVYLRVFERYTKPHWTKPGISFHRSCVKSALKVRKGERFVPEASVYRLLEALAHISDDSDLDYLRVTLTSKPEEVTSVTPHGEAEVYDIEVTGDHEYSAGGLLTHNCERSADVITTTYLDDNLREAGRTIVCNLKNRDNPHFPVFEAGVDFTCRSIYNIDPGESMTAEADADEVDALLEGV